MKSTRPAVIGFRGNSQRLKRCSRVIAITPERSVTRNWLRTSIKVAHTFAYSRESMGRLFACMNRIGGSLVGRPFNLLDWLRASLTQLESSGFGLAIRSVELRAGCDLSCQMQYWGEHSLRKHRYLAQLRTRAGFQELCHLPSSCRMRISAVRTHVRRSCVKEMS